MTAIIKRFCGSTTLLKLRRFVALWIIHISVFVLSGISAFLLRFDFQLNATERLHLLHALAVWIPVKSVAFHIFRINRTWWRYASLPDLQRIALALLSSAAVSTIIIALTANGFPRSVFIIDLLVCLIATCTICAAVRLHGERQVERKVNQVTTKRGNQVRVLVYGAGAAGTTLVRELRLNSQLRYEVCGYIDDNPFKTHAVIQGAPVLGTGDDLPRIARDLAINELLVAIPSASGHQMSRILEGCEQVGLPCRTIPGITEVIENRGLARQIRNIALEDLLGRMPIRLEQDQIASTLSGKTVLVTGAAGSIGSELCRQIARFSPASVVAFDLAETALFYLELEMRERFPLVAFHPEVGNVCDPRRLRDVFQKFRPSVVFHAAAYKHVPMMERQLFEAIENNVFGTVNVSKAAAQYEADRFVMISSDKAVHPTSIMGLTKRVSELYINSLRNETSCVSVRFGNVLGSNGSVIPIFSKQISAGGPVTVTHPEMRRYFMTIPEASQLVLQAGSMGQGGEIFILDMGQPVLITDLARKLIRLSGLRPEIDIQIIYTGMRPGEKLFEELTGTDESVLPTCHEKIRVHQGRRMPEEGARRYIKALETACLARDYEALLSVLNTLVPNYRPSDSVMDRIPIAKSVKRALSVAAGANSIHLPSPPDWEEVEESSL